MNDKKESAVQNEQQIQNEIMNIFYKNNLTIKEAYSVLDKIRYQIGDWAYEQLILLP